MYFFCYFIWYVNPIDVYIRVFAFVRFYLQIIFVLTVGSAFFLLKN